MLGRASGHCCQQQKTITAQGGGLASVRVGGGGQLSYRAPGIEILKEKELVAPKY